MAFRSSLIVGITPAWAGKSRGFVVIGVVCGDHPRVGGEKYCMLLCCPAGWGSPPRGRGKVLFAVCAMFPTGITPAWAGKRPLRPGVVIAGKDHPRVGGEKHHPTLSNAALPGSPPRGRGKGAGEPLRLLDGGITPAWAGKSCGRAAPRAQKGDHPRVGGEKYPSGGRPHCGGGSPPRGRGKD